MARKQDTRTTTRRPATKPRSAAKSPRARKSEPATKASDKVPAKPGRKPRAASRASVGMAALEAVRTPIAATAEDTKTKVKNETKKALKAAKKAKKAAKFPDMHMPHMPAGVTDAIKSVGGQIAGALNTDVGRVMVAELLMFMAKSLTKAASETETAHDAKSTLLNAGAKIGAAAADAGARMVDTGQAAGARLVDQGRAAVADGADAMSDARTLVKNVTDAAIGAVGGAVADVTSRVVGTRRRKAAAPPAEEASAPPVRKAGRPRRTPEAAASAASEDDVAVAPARRVGRPRRTPAANATEMAPPVDAEAGQTPPTI